MAPGASSLRRVPVPRKLPEPPSAGRSRKPRLTPVPVEPYDPPSTSSRRQAVGSTAPGARHSHRTKNGAGEQRPAGFRQILPRDAIFPVYNPTFRSAATSDWDDDILVIGLELDGEAKAYPVSFLNRREMVIDWIGGSPVLVTW